MYKVIKKLIAKNISISCAESITGGLIAKRITDIKGSSAILKESFIVYSNEAKIKLLNVDKNIIDKYGVVSYEVADYMVSNLKKLTNRDICISTTGNAGPSVCDNKPVGTVFVGIIYKDKKEIIECDFSKDIFIFMNRRKYIRNKTCKVIFNKINEFIND